MNTELATLLDEALAEPGGFVVALTGAGISAESGIPTFRGKEGYWTIGSREYHPQEMATHAMFTRQPGQVWQWYLYRRGVCRAADPNPGHRAMHTLERALGDRFVLVTQNVDGLHLRAGNSLARTWQIHGNIDYMRCAKACTSGLFPIPDGLLPWPRDRRLDDAARARLLCPRCGAPTRPHVLWFDECYDEELYRFESSLRAAAEAALLLLVGTAGATNLPNQMVSMAARAGAAIIDINPDDNPFGRVAARLHNGCALRGTSGEHLPSVAAHIAQTTAASAS